MNIYVFIRQRQLNSRSRPQPSPPHSNKSPPHSNKTPPITYCPALRKMASEQQQQEALAGLISEVMSILLFFFDGLFISLFYRMHLRWLFFKLYRTHSQKMLFLLLPLRKELILPTLLTCYPPSIAYKQLKCSW